MTMRDHQEVRRAIVAPAVETFNEGAAMWDEFADAARDRGDVAHEASYRESARRSRERAAGLLALAG